MSVQIQVTAETQQAARALSAFTKTASDGMNQLLGRTGVARDAMQAFQRTASLIGFQTAPRVTSAVYLASDSWKTLSGTMRLAGLGAGATGLALAGVTAIVGTGVAAWQAYRAELELTSAKSRKLAQDLENIGHTMNAIKVQVALGRLSEDEGKAMEKRLEDAKITDQKKAESLRPKPGESRFSNAVRNSSNAFASMGRGQRFESGEDANKAAVARLKEVLLNETQLRQLDELKAKKNQLEIAALDGYEKERAAVEENFKLESNRIKQLGSNLRSQDAELIAKANTANGAARTKALADIDKKETEAKQKALEDQLKITRDITEEIRKREHAADEFYKREDEHNRLVALQKINSSQFLTDAEKYDQTKAIDPTLVEGQADPHVMFEQMRAGLASLRSEWGTLQQQISQGFYSSINNSINQVSDGLTGLIMRTEGWRDRLAQIPQQILSGIVGAIIQMGLRWIATQIMMAVAGKAIAAAALVPLKAVAAAQTAIWTTPAYLATVSSYGGAAVAAPGQMSAGLAQAALISAIAAGAGMYYEGGYTGHGGKYDVAGLVHRGEYVMDAETTSRIGVRNLDVLRSGGGSKSSGGSVGDAVREKMTVFFFDSKAAIKDFVESNLGKEIVIRHVNDSRLQLGFDT